jgi:hypothetical protein
MKSGPAFAAIEPQARGRKTVRLFAVLSLAGIVTVVVLSTLILIWLPTDGAPFSLDNGRIDEVDTESRAARAGLRVGDVLAPNTPFFVREGLGNWLYFRPVQFSFDVIRNGQLKHIRLSVNSFNFDNNNPTGPEVAMVIINVLVFLVCAWIGTVVVLLRPTPLTWAFFIYCIGTITLTVAVVQVTRLIPLPLGLAVQMIRITLSVAGLFALLVFALRLPSDEVRGWRRRVAIALPFFAAVFLLCSYLPWVIDLYPAAFNYNVLPYVWFGVPIAVAVLSIASAVGIYRSSDLEVKERLKWATIGIVLASIAIASRAVLQFTNQFFNLEWLGWGTILGAFFAPLAVAYAILKHRVMDVRFVVNRAVVYLVITSLLAITLGAAYWLTNTLLQHTQAAMALQLVFAIAAGVILHRVYRQLDSAINRLLFRRRYEGQEHLQRITDGLPCVESLRELETLLTKEPVIAFDLLCGAVYHKNLHGDYERHETDETQTLPLLLRGEEPLIVRALAHHDAFSLTPPVLHKLAPSH